MPPPAIVIVRDLRFSIGQSSRLDPVFNLFPNETNEGAMLPGIEAREPLLRPEQSHLGPPSLVRPERYADRD